MNIIIESLLLAAGIVSLVISYMYETESSHYQEFLDDGGQSSSHILGKVMSLETRIENIKSEKVLTT